MTDTYRIKALEFNRGEFSELDSYTPFGRYEIDVRSEHDWLAYFYFGSSSHCVSMGRSFNSIDAAKTACEKHWSDTIKQALEEV